MRWLLILLAAAAAAQDAPELAQIVERAFQQDRRNEELAKSYTYTERVEERKLDSRGAVKDIESKTFDVTFLYDEPYERLVARDGQPLQAKEAAKEQTKLDKEMDKRANESDKAREKRLANKRKEEEERRRMRAEIVQAFDFTLEGEEQRDGVPCWRIRADPKPGYEPGFKDARFLTKLHGRFWIAKHDYGWVRAEAETIENASFGLFLLKLREGARMEFEQRELNGEVWMLDTFRLKFDAKIGLLKGLRREIEVGWSDFRKFEVESKLLAAEP